MHLVVVSTYSVYTTKGTEPPVSIDRMTDTVLEKMTDLTSSKIL